MIQCKRCNRKPKDIIEYVVSAEDYGCTPNEYVKMEEGTYNDVTKKFYCTRCYISVGMPLGKA